MLRFFRKCFGAQPAAESRVEPAEQKKPNLTVNTNVDPETKPIAILKPLTDYKCFMFLEASPLEDKLDLDPIFKGERNSEMQKYFKDFAGKTFFATKSGNKWLHPTIADMMNKRKKLVDYELSNTYSYILCFDVDEAIVRQYILEGKLNQIIKVAASYLDCRDAYRSGDRVLDSSKILLVQNTYSQDDEKKQSTISPRA